jgi:hypothetical protein
MRTIEFNTAASKIGLKQCQSMCLNDPTCFGYRYETWMQCPEGQCKPGLIHCGICLGTRFPEGTCELYGSDVQTAPMKAQPQFTLLIGSKRIGGYCWH